jgi:hypothetical protein
MDFVTKHVMKQHALLTTSYHSELCTFSDFFGLDFVPRGVLFELDFLDLAEYECEPTLASML